MNKNILNQAFKNSIQSTIKYLIKDDVDLNDIKFKEHEDGSVSMRYKYWQLLPDKVYSKVNGYLEYHNIDTDDEGRPLIAHYIKPALINRENSGVVSLLSINNHNQLKEANELLRMHSEETNPFHYQGEINKYNEKWGLNE